MYDHILDEAELFLEQDEDIIVPVKKIWMRIRQIAEDNDWRMPSLAEFTSLLMQDERFEFMPEQEDSSVEEDLPEEELETEELNFYSGQRVKLARIELTPERLGQMIRRKVDDTMDALMKAWDKRPDGDSPTEGKLLEVLSQTQKFQREVKDTFSEVKMRKLTKALAGKAKGRPSKAKKKVTKKRPVGKRKSATRLKSSSKRKASSRKRRR